MPKTVRYGAHRKINCKDEYLRIEGHAADFYIEHKLLT
jgi:hypothetical protein